MSDFMVSGGFGVFAPILAVFVTNQISGGSIATVGIAAAIVQIVKVIFQIPIAHFLDKDHGEYDDFFSMIFGSFLVALVPFLYLFADKIAHVYIIQGLYGLGLAFLVPPWYAIFSRHLDKMNENIEWSIESVSIGIAGALSAGIGGFLAQKFGFNIVFFVGGVVSLFGAFMQTKIYGDIRAKVPRGTVRATPDKAPGV